MASDGMIFKQPEPEPTALFTAVEKKPKAPRRMVLDMGEGSREEGFRLNGSR